MNTHHFIYILYQEPGDGGIDLFGGLLGTIYFTFKRIINRIRHVYTRYL